MKNSIIKDALVLFLITLTSGLCLGVVWQVTKEPISLAQERAKQRAYETVYKGASFSKKEELNQLVKESSAYFEESYDKSLELLELLEASGAGGDPMGYVLTAVSKEGYGGDIKFSIGIKRNGTITGYEVLSMSETPGLGARCTKSEFKKQFAGICTNEISYTKTGEAGDNEVDALSGATITTRAVTNSLNGVIAFLEDRGLITFLHEGGQNE